jgi:hypothetical protein
MRQFAISLLTLINIMAFVGIFYYAIPGYEHIFVGGIGSQGNATFVCIVLSLFTFFTSIQLTPTSHEDIEAVRSGTCWACGQRGRELVWWHSELYDSTGKLHNQRMSYLIHRSCFYLAEKQAGGVR